MDAIRSPLMVLLLSPHRRSAHCLPFALPSGIIGLARNQPHQQYLIDSSDYVYNIYNVCVCTYVDVERRPADCIRTEYWQQPKKKAINFDSVNNNSFFFPLSTALKSMHICTIYFAPGEIFKLNLYTKFKQLIKPLAEALRTVQYNRHVNYLIPGGKSCDFFCSILR